MRKRTVFGVLAAMSDALVGMVAVAPDTARAAYGWDDDIDDLLARFRDRNRSGAVILVAPQPSVQEQQHGSV